MLTRCCLLYGMNKLKFQKTQDEVRDPRQVSVRPTWVVDRGVRCDHPQWSGKNCVAPSVWPMAILVCSVWRIPIFQTGQYPYFGLFCLANTHFSVCSVWPIPIFRSVWSGQYLISRPRGPAEYEPNCINACCIDCFSK